MTILSTVSRLALASAVLAALVPAARADDVADFYRGKNLRIFVGYGPGSGYDVYARLLGRHMTRHVPGNPNIIVQNMPGAASLTMTNHLFNVAPRDGTAIGTIARWNLTDQLYGHPNIRYDSRKFTALGSMNREAGTCFTWHTTGIDSIEAAMKREVLVGATGATGTSLQFPLLLNALIGTKFKPITGYPDSGAVGLAMERGELQGYCSFTWGSIKGARPQWVKDKLINLILQLTLRKHPELPHVPLVMDYAKDEGARQAFALAFADQEIARPVVGPPGIPSDRAAALRKAFAATMKDKGFVADATAANIDIDPVDAKEFEAVLNQIHATPPDVIARVKAIYSGKGK